MKRRPILIIITPMFTALACGQSISTPWVTPPAAATANLSREGSLPPTARKLTPAEDAWPPLAAGGLGQPQPFGEPINTAGAEDSPFITLNGDDFYFFFTPDPNIPAEKQLFDGVTGIWRSTWDVSRWSEPARVLLAEPGEPALDGCEFILGDQMWFCSARVGNLREIDLYLATMEDGRWVDWRNAGRQINLEYETGEMHISADGQTLIFASTRTGGFGGYDLWISSRSGDTWDSPINLGSPVNSEGDENRPYLSPDGGTLWFDSNSKRGMPGPAIFRSVRQSDGNWSPPEEMVSQFAGEPSLSPDGHTLYFTHHFFTADLSTMIEADIYSVAIP